MSNYTPKPNIDSATVAQTSTQINTCINNLDLDNKYNQLNAKYSFDNFFGKSALNEDIRLLDAVYTLKQQIDNSYNYASTNIISINSEIKSLDTIITTLNNELTDLSGQQKIINDKLITYNFTSQEKNGYNSAVVLDNITNTYKINIPPDITQTKFDNMYITILTNNELIKLLLTYNINLNYANAYDTITVKQNNTFNIDRRINNMTITLLECINNFNNEFNIFTDLIIKLNAFNIIKTEINPLLSSLESLRIALKNNRATSDLIKNVKNSIDFKIIENLKICGYLNSNGLPATGNPTINLILSSDTSLNNQTKVNNTKSNINNIFSNSQINNLLSSLITQTNNSLEKLKIYVNTFYNIIGIQFTNKSFTINNININIISIEPSNRTDYLLVSSNNMTINKGIYLKTTTNTSATPLIQITFIYNSQSDSFNNMLTYNYSDNSVQEILAFKNKFPNILEYIEGYKNSLNFNISIKNKQSELFQKSSLRASKIISRSRYNQIILDISSNQVINNIEYNSKKTRCNTRVSAYNNYLSNNIINDISNCYVRDVFDGDNAVNDAISKNAPKIYTLFGNDPSNNYTILNNLKLSNTNCNTHDIHYNNNSNIYISMPTNPNTTLGNISSIIPSIQPFTNKEGFDVPYLNKTYYVENVNDNYSNFLTDIRYANTYSKFILDLKNTKDLSQNIINMQKNIEIDMYYILKYNAQKDLLKYVIFICCIALLGSVAYHTGLIPSAIYTLYLIIVFSLGFVIVIYKYIDIYTRTQTDFNERDFNSIYKPKTDLEKSLKSKNPMELSKLPTLCPV